MTKQRYTIPGGGKFSTYEEAKRFRNQQLEIDATVRDGAPVTVEFQIRKYSGGFKVVVRREVGQ